MAENGIEYQMSMPDSPQQNGHVERFQQTIVNGAEAIQHHAGLSRSFWIYTAKAKLHMYNHCILSMNSPTGVFSDYKVTLSRHTVSTASSHADAVESTNTHLSPPTST